MSDKLKIGGITYQVAKDPALHDTGFSGQIRYHRCQVVVAGDLHPSALAQTLWHEIVHGILTQAGMTKHQESIVDALAYGILQVIRENPEFVEMCKSDGSATNSSQSAT
jgi:hypothetical protein